MVKAFTAKKSRTLRFRREFPRFLAVDVFGCYPINHPKLVRRSETAADPGSDINKQKKTSISVVFLLCHISLTQRNISIMHPVLKYRFIHLILGNKYVTFISTNFYHEGEGGH